MPLILHRENIYKECASKYEVLCVRGSISYKEMSYRHTANHRYGQGQQPYKRPRDDGERDPRGPREGRDLRDALGQESSRPHVPQQSAPHVAAAAGASKEVGGIMLARGDAAVEWEILNGLLVKDENMRLLHIPVSLHPIPFPRSVFNSIWDLQALLQQLCDASLDVQSQHMP
jgi:hypothetical protein